MSRRWIALVIFLLALIPRVLPPGPSINWDEPQWVFRSAKFLMSLGEGRWADTFQARHPGVTTMWAGALGIFAQRLVQGVQAPSLEPIRQLANLDVQNAAALDAVGPYLQSGRLVVGVITALCIAALYFLAWPLLGAKTAFLGAALIALDPFYLAHSRFLHVDALLASFMILSLLSLLRYFHEPKLRFVAASGALAGLALLTKSPAIFLPPFVALLVTGWTVVRLTPFAARAIGQTAACRPRQEIVRLLCIGLLWSAAWACLFVALYPAMWVNPAGTVRSLFGAAGHAVSTPHINNFFLGRVIRDPGLPFYLLALAFRLTPLVALGLFLALIMVWKREPGRRAVVIILLFYTALFMLLMTSAAKKFDRYLLPAFPALDLLAAVGLVALLRWLARWRNLGQRAGRTMLAGGIALVIVVQAAGTLLHHPYYLTYYNPLLGGGRRAVQTITVGWGEGLDQAARYLNQQPDAEELEVAAWGVAGLAPLLQGHVHVLDERSPVLADYVVLNVGDVQFGSPYISDYRGQVEPEYVVRLHGVEYAWVYRNDRYVEYLEALERLVGEGDVVVFAGRSQLSGHWPMERPCLVLDPAGDEAQIAQALNGVAQPGRMVWIVAFAGDDAERDGVRRQLATHALRLAEHPLPPLTVTAYRLLPETAFASLQADVPVEVSFAGRLSLVGLGLSGMQLAPSQKMDIILHWQATSPVEEDYTAFVHLLDEEGKRLAQRDERLLDAASQPTSAWAVGESQEMRFLLDIPADAPPGDYVLIVGLYRPDTGDRLWLDGVKGLQDHTAYPLAVVRVVGP